MHPLSGRRVPAAEAVRALLDWVRPALRATGDEEELRALTAGVLAHGTGADRQRRQLGSGPWTPLPIV
ncbi:hypothetical protein [Streptomyces sp. CC228A]|uniref:hypothetical protein n=1 Tax=Streptomyces sp. CC228A TaxID=2898186 RepID=UPI001F1A10B9|nr:hypothetical protein [Streptomyces sp. CC228A]